MASSEVVDSVQGRRLTIALLKKLNSLMNSVNAVLDDAEEKQVSKPAVKMWLDELKDAVFEADDLFDEISYRALRARLESPSQNSIRQNPLKRGMKWKLEDVLRRIEYLVKQKDALGLRHGIGENPSLQRLPSTSLVDESGVYGRDGDKRAIMGMLLSDYGSHNAVGVIPIVGMGGVGKTTLAQIVYNDNVVRERFDLMAWVCVSKEADVSEVTKDILEEVTGRKCFSTTLNQLQVMLKEKLNGKKFLLVLDDVWNDKYAHWDILLRPLKSGTEGSKVVVTTRHETVASVMGTVVAYHLRELSDDDCWCLFLKHVFEEGKSGRHIELELIGREILSELPKSLSKLKHLRYMNLSGSSIRRLPATICKLYNLQTLILFECKELQGDCSIKELGELQHLQEQLRICSLQNVTIPRDALQANLKGKKNIKKLKLEWDNGDGDFMSHMEVLEQLQPHRNIESLSIDGYGGSRFPAWVGDFYYSNMVSLKLTGCWQCSSLPPLGQLVSLEDLWITGFDQLVVVGPDVYGNCLTKKPPFASLKSLTFELMPKWQEWSAYNTGRYDECGAAFPLLQELYIRECPALTGALPGHLPSLTTLKIEGCPQLVASLPRSPDILRLHLKDNNRLMRFVKPCSFGLYHLIIEGFNCIDSLLQDMEQMCGLTSSLQEIEIKNCCEVKIFPVEMFPELKTLRFSSCPRLQRLFPPEANNDYLKNLSSLEIMDCPGLGSFLNRRLPAPNLSRFMLLGCSNLASFPGEKLLPSTLTSLKIGDFQNLTSLDFTGLRHLTGLRELEICNCPKLRSLPDEGLPFSLSSLSVFLCPLLEHRCQPYTGEDWPKICHIPHIEISFFQISCQS
ncbi:unnamed protein product [Linum tenue]|uniref:Disease resistance RPP13-like protein 1 n=1 Tax=Linum tenue TaxID=586396 RepID=A0AAV0NSR1_9ROSI|nr:unnamed protein product [Linum tenue]